MSKQNKFAGNMGRVASGGSSVNGNSNVYRSAPRAGSGARDPSSVKDNVTKDKISLTGMNSAVVPDGQSSHNTINAFTRGIKSRGPYGGPSFASFNNSRQHMQSTDTSAGSKFKNPSGK